MSWNSLSFAAAVELAGHGRSGVGDRAAADAAERPRRRLPARSSARSSRRRRGASASRRSRSSRSRAGACCEHCRVMRVLERLDEIYAIAQHRAGLLARGGRGARARRRLDARGRARGRASTRPATSSAAAARHVSGPARISTASRPPAASTARSASSRRSRRRSGCPTRRSRSSRSAPRRRGPMGSRRLERAARTRSSSCTSSRAPCSSGSASRSAIVTAIAGQARGEVVVRRAAPTTPARRRWTRAPTRSSRRRASSCTCATSPRDGAVATVGAIEVEPNAVNVVPARVTVSVDARAPDARAARRARRGDRLRAALAARAGRDERRAARRAPRSGARRARARLRRRPRRDGPRGRRRPDRDALRPQPERRRQPPPGRAVERRGHRARVDALTAALARLALR